MNAITVDRVSKRYGKVEALKELSFSVKQGELFGIIGPDGAGKTTLFRILTTLLLADQGIVTIDGLDVVANYKQLRARIGYMPGRFSLYPDLSVEENLTLFATVFNTSIQANYHLIEGIYKQIEPFKKRKAGALSGGMKQKLALCCALIHKPSVLFLDEPTTGVDPVSRKEFWEMLKALKAENITMLVSTPYMDEASLCDQIALMQEGVFLQIDTPQAIIDRFETQLWAVKSDQMYRLLIDLRQHPSINSCFAFGDTHHITPNEPFVDPIHLETYLIALGHQQIEIKQIQASIEDCYMQLSQK